MKEQGSFEHNDVNVITLIVGVMLVLIGGILDVLGVKIDYQKYANVPMYACFLLLGGVILSLVLIGVIKHRRELRQQHEPRQNL